MSEIIKSIEEVKVVNKKCTFAGGEGYEIITNKQNIYILIDAYHQCCENFGYIISEDNFKYFIGSELLDIKIIDGDYKTYSFFNNFNSEDLKTVFVNLETSNGTLQFVLYNEHNGFYGHTVKVISNQLNLENEI